MSEVSAERLFVPPLLDEPVPPRLRGGFIALVRSKTGLHVGLGGLELNLL